VILCVKLWDVEAAGEAIRPIVGPQTAVIPQQNGVDAHERLIPILGRKAVMGGTAWVTGSIIAPGVVRQTGTYQRLIFGARRQHEPARPGAVRCLRRSRV
jgi:2-dehydropantoate 2-reductase